MQFDEKTLKVAVITHWQAYYELGFGKVVLQDVPFGTGIINFTHLETTQLNLQFKKNWIRR